MLKWRWNSSSVSDSIGLNCVHAGVVHQDVDRPEMACRFGEQVLDIRGLCDVALDRDGLAAGAGDVVHDFVRDVPAARVVHDNGSTLGRQLAGDLRADPFGGAGDDRDFLRQLAH